MKDKKVAGREVVENKQYEASVSVSLGQRVEQEEKLLNRF